MSEISKAYEPQSVEDKWYDFWLKQSCFTANPKSAKPAYSIVIPPPNVTGMLHMGHVLNNTIQDILSRKARMDGKEVLWLPGTDHAGIATQVMVEKQLKKEEKKSRHDLGREEFLKRVWVWKEKHGDIIINQLKKLGCSCDWTRERFTMDPEYSRCVQKVFVELYKKNLIYRGKRMVNWCPVSQTALSDEEVEMKPQKGFMYHFKVEVAESAEFLGSARVSRADSGVAPESSSDKLVERASGATPDAATGTVALPENFDARKANTLAVIDFVLSHTIRMFHPFLPFITEELWHGMGYATDMPENQGGKTIMNAPWPLPFDDDFKGHYGLDDCYVEMTDTKYELVRNGRDLRRAGNIQAAKKVKYVFKPAQHLTPHDAEVIKLLLNAESLEVNDAYQPPKGTPTVNSKLGELFLPLEGLIDVAAEKIRLGKEIEKIQSEIVKVEQKLANPSFTAKVPPAVLAEHQQRLTDWKTKLAHTQASLKVLAN